MLDPMQAKALIESARAAREQAYAPYSGFRVGAALLDRQGGVHTGSNVENASYGLSTCAERAAMVGAVGRGIRDFKAIAVVGPTEGEACTPCGSCRQILFEFAPGLEVVTTAGDEPHVKPLTALLPDAFGPASLGRSRSPAADGDADG